jgi:hypothetical protein
MSRVEVDRGSQAVPGEDEVTAADGGRHLRGEASMTWSNCSYGATLPAVLSTGSRTALASKPAGSSSAQLQCPARSGAPGFGS